MKAPCRRCGALKKITPSSHRDDSGQVVIVCHPCRRMKSEAHGPNRPNRRCSCGRLTFRRAGRCYVCAPDRSATTARGYGTAHQRTRRAYLAAFKPGDPCARCGEPLTGVPSEMHLDHTDDRTGYLGLSHYWCNAASSGGRHVRVGRPWSRDRQCAWCMNAFTAQKIEQRYCGRACSGAARSAGNAEARKAG